MHIGNEDSGQSEVCAKMTQPVGEGILHLRYTLAHQVGQQYLFSIAPRPAQPVGFSRTVAPPLHFAVSFHMAGFTAVEACHAGARGADSRRPGLGRVGSIHRTDGVTGAAVKFCAHFFVAG